MKHLLLTDLTGQRNVLSIQRIFVKLTGSHAIALFLAECWYWQHRANERGDAWFHMPLTTTRPGFPSWADYDLKRSHIDAARALLEPAGILKYHGSTFHEGYKTSWYELNLEALDEAVGRFKATGETLERTLTIAAWRVWRKEQSRRSLNGKSRSCRPIRAAAAAVKAPAPRPIEQSAPQSQPIAASVAVLDRPEPAPAKSQEVSLPIDSDDWKRMPPVERAKVVDWVRWTFPKFYWQEAYALGFGDLMGGKRRDRDDFTEEAIDAALKHLRSTSQGGNAQRHNAEAWLCRACLLLKSHDERELEDGLTRLTGIRKAIQSRRALTAPIAPLSPTDQPSEPVRQPAHPPTTVTNEEARAMSDEEILANWQRIPHGHPWQEWARIRYRRQELAKSGNYRELANSMRKAGDPLDKGIHHRSGFDPTPYI